MTLREKVGALTQHEKSKFDTLVSSGTTDQDALIEILFERTEQLIDMLNVLDGRVVAHINRNPIFR